MFSHSKPNSSEPVQYDTYREAYRRAYYLATKWPYDRHLRGFIQRKSKPVGSLYPFRKELTEAHRGFLDGYFMAVINLQG